MLPNVFPFYYLGHLIFFKFLICGNSCVCKYSAINKCEINTNKNKIYNVIKFTLSENKILSHHDMYWHCVPLISGKHYAVLQISWSLHRSSLN